MEKNDRNAITISNTVIFGYKGFGKKFSLYREGENLRDIEKI